MSKYEHKEKSSVLIYHNVTGNLELIAKLQGYAPLGKLLLDIMHYSKDNKIPEYSADEGMIQLVFNQIKDSIDINRKKYDETCIRNANNRNKQKNSISTGNSQFINSETGEVIASDMLSDNEEDNDSRLDSAIPTEKMILDYFIHEKEKPIKSEQAKDCREYCILYKNGRYSWKENADLWAADHLTF